MMYLSKWIRPTLGAGAVAALVCFCANATHAQDVSLPPTFGSATFKAGFAPDPFVKTLTAGGPIKTKLGGVSASIAKAPDFKLNYTAGNLPLTFHVKSKGDTTLLINLPNGTWLANDDGGAGLNPLIKIAKPMSGRYDIYVGTFGKTLVPATLFITELGTSNVDPKPKPPVGAGGPDVTLPATFGSTTLKAGFTPDPFVKTLTAGGPIKTKLGGVNASVAKAPDFKLNYTAGTLPLTFHVKSKGDTTLLINLPNGTWLANDDGGAGLNPLIKIAKPMSGRYDIYVGTYGKTLVPATLYITELGTANVDPKPKPPGGAGTPDITLPPTFGSTTLKTGFTPDPFVKTLTAGGPINTKLGGVNSFVAKAPDFQLNFTAGNNLPLTFHVRSKGDTTLLINLPNGTWLANDDGGKGLNPLITLTKPMSGRYDIYVGTYGKTLVPATLYITELPTKNKD